MATLNRLGHAADCPDAYDDDEYPYYGECDECTHCGGEGVQEPDDPIYEGDGWIDCKACYGTGHGCRQWVW